MTSAGTTVLVVLLVWAVPLVAIASAPAVPAAPPVVPAAGETPTAPDRQPVRIVAVLPNPVAEGDAGEYVAVELPSPTNLTGWSIDDGESAPTFPPRTLSGRVIATTDPTAVRAPEGNATVVRLAGHLALSNAGETIELRSDDGEAVDAVAYEDAPEGQRYVRADEGWTWRTPGTTDLPVAVARDVRARLFVLPDAPSVPIEAIAAASDRVLLAAYTFSSERVAGELCDARDRGVEVAVLLEGDPVGGTTVSSARVLDRLVACGVDVSALGGPGDRYTVHHPKYAVVDDRALVLSENWKPAGVGGRSSRGWGVVVDSPRVADALAETFEADAGYRDARPWAEVRDETDAVDEPVANGSFPEEFAPETVRVDRAEVLVAPDNAEDGIVALIDDAERSVRIQQVAIGSRGHPFVEATVRAAERGASVSVLLSGAWYVREDNRRLVEWLERRGREEGLPIEARIVRPRSRFAKTHVKGLIVDDEAAVVGSLNWNAHATRENREVVVVLHDREAAAYYGRVFRADWRGGVWRLPAGLGLVTALAAVGATVHLRRSVRFEGMAPDGEPPPSVLPGAGDGSAPFDGSVPYDGSVSAANRASARQSASADRPSPTDRRSSTNDRPPPPNGLSTSRNDRGAPRDDRRTSPTARRPRRGER